MDSCNGVHFSAFIVVHDVLASFNWYYLQRVFTILILEWTKLVWTPALGVYTGMDKTSLDTSSGSLFVTHSGCPHHVERN